MTSPNLNCTKMKLVDTWTDWVTIIKVEPECAYNITGILKMYVYVRETVRVSVCVWGVISMGMQVASTEAII